MRADDPNLPDLRRIAEALGELREQVVLAKVDLDPNGTQKRLDAAIAPVADRLLKRYKAVQ
jgi:type I restriction enzyme R subunit